MSVIGEIRVSLDAMGVEQQTLLFIFLTSYPLALGRLLGARGRHWAAGTAAAAALGFVACTDPWVHGVLGIAAMIVAMGLFIAMACALDRLPRLMSVAAAAPGALAGAAMASSEPRERLEARPPALPLTGRAGTT